MQNVKHLFRGPGSRIYLPVCVFAFKVPGNIRRVVAGEAIGTVVRNGRPSG